MQTRLIPLLTSVLTLFLLAGCGGSENQAVEVIPALTISGVDTTAGVWSDLTSPPVAIEIGCDASLAVSVIAQDFALEAPGTCGSVARCGYVEVTLTREGDNVAEPARGIGLSPILLQGSPDALSGELAVTARLIRDDGFTYLTNAGAPIEASVTLDVGSSCQ